MDRFRKTPIMEHSDTGMTNAKTQFETRIQTVSRAPNCMGRESIELVRGKGTHYTAFLVKTISPQNTHAILRLVAARNTRVSTQIASGKYLLGTNDKGFDPRETFPLSVHIGTGESTRRDWYLGPNTRFFHLGRPSEI